MRTIGVVIGEHGGALVTVVRDDEDGLLVAGIERLPASLAAVSERLQALDDGECRFVVDAEGLGRALWRVVGEPTDKKRAILYEATGRERQGLVDTLLVAIHEGRFHFAPALHHQEPMSKALVSYRKSVGADGFISGSELVLALLMALTPPPRPSVYESHGLQNFGGDGDRPQTLHIRVGRW